MWDQKLEEEMRRTDPLEGVRGLDKRVFFFYCYVSKECKALRNELDEQHKIRMESFEIKMKPIIIRDGPSKKVTTLKFLKQ